MLPISFSLSENPQAGSTPFFNLHPRTKSRLLAIFQLIRVNFSVPDCSFLSVSSPNAHCFLAQNTTVRLLVISLAHYEHCTNVFLKHILSNLSPYSLSQSLLQFQVNLRILDLEECLLWELIEILPKCLYTKWRHTEDCSTTEMTKSLSRFPRATVSLRNAIVPHPCSSFPQHISSRFTQPTLSWDHLKGQERLH